jgi:hypothetical protein
MLNYALWMQLCIFCMPAARDLLFCSAHIFLYLHKNTKSKYLCRYKIFATLLYSRSSEWWGIARENTRFILISYEFNYLKKLPKLTSRSISEKKEQEKINTTSVIWKNYRRWWDDARHSKKDTSLTFAELLMIFIWPRGESSNIDC